jgi:hypothetical protein
MSQPSDFTLIPAEESEGSTPDEDLAAAISSALSEDDLGEPDEPPVPFGRSWPFDYQTGRFRRAGTSPATVTGLDALREWCMTALSTARNARGTVLPSVFGMENLNAEIGQLVGPEVMADMKLRITDALLVHDRITAVTDFDMYFDQTEQALVIRNFTVVTDEDQSLVVRDLLMRTT